MIDQREASERAAWLARCGYRAATLVPLAGDVSARRYARVEDGLRRRAILAEYPLELRAAGERFVATTALLSAAGVRVPAILAFDPGAGRMLVEDVGGKTLYEVEHRAWTDLEPLLESAVATAARIGTLDPAAVVAVGNPPLDATLLRRELGQTWDRFLVPHDLVGTSAQADSLATAFDELCARLGTEPSVPCHRDFMARNLVPLGGAGELAVLDHQDLRLGPPAYDLAALLHDSLFPPPQLVEKLVASAFARGLSRDALARATVQRTLKAVGTFAAFAARGNPRHLPLVRPTFARALAPLLALPETSAIAHQLAPRWRAFLAAADGSGTLTVSGSG